MPYATARRGRPRKNGPRYPSGKLRHANGEPVDALMKWRRQREAVEAEVIDRRWGSQVGRLHRFGVIGGADADAIFRWVEIQSRADAIRGLPQRTVRSPSHDPAMRGRSEPQARPVTAAELDALEAADEACKALVREASAAALEALRAVALCDLPPSS